MEQFLSHFTLDIIGIVLLSILLIVFFIQIYFYLGYYKKPLSYFKKTSSEKEDITKLPSVSVIIVAKNESENLARCLPAILQQDYPIMK